MAYLDHLVMDHFLTVIQLYESSLGPELPCSWMGCLAGPEYDCCVHICTNKPHRGGKHIRVPMQWLEHDTKYVKAA